MGITAAMCTPRMFYFKIDHELRSSFINQQDNIHAKMPHVLEKIRSKLTMFLREHYCSDAFDSILKIFCFSSLIILHMISVKIKWSSLENNFVLALGKGLLRDIYVFKIKLVP